jgi:hypothetical protein
VLGIIALATVQPVWAGVRSQALPAVNITSVSVDSNSVKVDFQPVPGAQDYRIFDISNPYDVKYAGIWQLDADYLAQWSSVHFAVDSSGNYILPLQVVPNAPETVPGQPWTSPDSKYHHASVPAMEIEFNGLLPNQPTTLVVEAVDAVGPASYMTLSNFGNNRIFPLDADCDPAIGACALGSNMGCTWWADQMNIDMMSTNGQGDFHNNPNVIARSQPFVVTANGIGPLPDTNEATQVFCDTFASGTFTQPTNMNIIGGTERYTMTTPAGVWDVQTDTADIRDSSTFVHKGHLMDVLFDGSTPGSNDPLHVAHGVLTFSPQQTVDFSNGQILHVTMEVDAHTDARRWVAFNLAPADDPLQHWYNGLELNNTDTGFFVQFQNTVALADEYVGPAANGTPHDLPIAGPAGGAENLGYRKFINYQYGHGLDDRSRFDLFISTTHFAVYEDGNELYEYDLPVPLPFSQAKVYYTGYLYHSALEQQELEEYRPYENYWINMYPFSDERHWDNMGFEVLPSGTAWNSLRSLIVLPQPTAPFYTNATVPIVNNGNGGDNTGGTTTGGTTTGGSTGGTTTTGGTTGDGTTSGGGTTTGGTTGGSTTSGTTTGGDSTGGTTTGGTSGGSSTGGTTGGSTTGDTTGGSTTGGTTGTGTTGGSTGGTTSGGTTGGTTSGGTTGGTTSGGTTGGGTTGGTTGGDTGGTITTGTTGGTTTGGTDGGSTGGTTGGTVGNTGGSTGGSGGKRNSGPDKHWRSKSGNTGDGGRRDSGGHNN